MLSLVGAAWASEQPSTLPSTETIVAHMREARAKSRAQLRPYQVVRDYQLFGKEQKSKSQVTAYIAYVPPDVQNFTLHKQQRREYGRSDRAQNTRERTGDSHESKRHATSRPRIIPFISCAKMFSITSPVTCWSCGRCAKTAAFGWLRFGSTHPVI